jgi:type I restriction enzyme, S subunit
MFVYIDISSVDNTTKRVVAAKTLGIKGAPSRARQNLKAGDVLVSMTRPNLNAVALVTDDLHGAIGSTGFHVLRATGIHPQWLFLAVQTHSFIAAMSAVVQGALYPAVRPKDIRSWKLPIPPLAEQVRIVEKTDELFSDLDAGIAALARVREKLKLYRASVLKAAVEGALTAEWRAQHPDTESAIELLERILVERRRRWEEEQVAKFKAKGREPPRDWKTKYKEPIAPQASQLSDRPKGWCSATAEQVCEFITKGTTPPGSKSPQSNGEIPFIKVQHLSGTGDFHFFESPSFVSRDTHEHFLARSKVFPGDVLMNIVGPPLGQVSVVPTTYPEWNINQAIAIFRGVGEVPSVYLATCLVSPTTVSDMLRRTKTTAGQVNLTLPVCREVVIPFPPLAEQEAIVEAVEDQLSVINHLEADIDAKLKAARSLRQAILRHAFTGQLVPQDPNDEPASELLKRIAAKRDERARSNVKSKPEKKPKSAQRAALSR